MLPPALFKINTTYTDAEQQQAAQTVELLVYLSIFTYIILAIASSMVGMHYQTILTIILILSLTYPLYQLKTGKVDLAALFAIFNGIIAITILATIGQGIRDLSLIGIPILFIFAGITLTFKNYLIVILAEFCSIVWLAAGEIFTLYTPKPFNGDQATWISMVLILVLLAIAAIVVWLLALNLRQNLRTANLEIARRKQVEELLRKQATHDNLTGIYNRHYFEEELNRLQRSRDYPISIIVGDLDDLKKINDHFGHLAGDAAIIAAAQILTKALRASDLLARIGGDEFCALFPNTNESDIAIVHRRIENEIARHNQTLPPNATPIKISLGVATANQNDLLAVFKAADTAMYQQKKLRHSQA